MACWAADVVGATDAKVTLDRRFSVIQSLQQGGLWSRRCVFVSRFCVKISGKLTSNSSFPPNHPAKRSNHAHKQACTTLHAEVHALQTDGQFPGDYWSANAAATSYMLSHMDSVTLDYTGGLVLRHV